MLAQIEINDDLIQAAMKATGLGSETETVEAGLKLLLRQQGNARLLELGGKLQWEDNGTAGIPCMIMADSSVWIDHFNGVITHPVEL